MTIERALIGTADGGAGEYVEDVFSTYLYTGTGAAQTITNGIGLAGKGGMVWLKERSAATDHALYDTVRGATKDLVSNSTLAETTQSTGLTAFGSTGFSIGALAKLNTSAATYASWTFRKAPKFFDVVTYTGNGVSGKQISHSLGSTPGCILVKCTSAIESWYLYHASLGATKFMYFNSTANVQTSSTAWANTSPTSSNFTVGSDSNVNTNGATYVAYLFAHDAGGFGASGTDSIVSCGSYTGNGSATGPTITLGWEPQWVMVKNTTTTADWGIHDNMRGFSIGSGQALIANSTNAESATGIIEPTPTGFRLINVSPSYNGSGNTYIYLAIRRGPMKTPTSGASVFAPVKITATQSTQNVTSVGFPPDMIINGVRSNANYGQQIVDRLRGVSKHLYTPYTSLEYTSTSAVVSLDMSGFTLGPDSSVTGWNAYSGYTSIKWNFRRAPGFFDVVCYTGTGVARTVNHNLGVAPELMIVKARSIIENWAVYSSQLGATKVIFLNLGNPPAVYNIWNDTSPTSLTFTLLNDTAVNGSGSTYVAYLFASCPGVSKVGSYTGNGSSQTINCGFTAGARFVLIKRTDSTGDWYVWDTARGISASTDPHLSLNTTVAEVTTDDSIDPDATGFIVNQVAATNINVSSATYIFLAIA
jgi:hypothetical protein